MDKLEGYAARLKKRLSFRFAFAVLVPLVLLFGLIYLYRHGGGPNFIPRCPVYALTGLYCPGCGSGRALYSILHGHLLNAFDYNPLFVILSPLAVYLVISGYLKAVTGRNILPAVSITLNQACFFTLVIVLYAVARNIPLYPFTYLAP